MDELMQKIKEVLKENYAEDVFNMCKVMAGCEGLEKKEDRALMFRASMTVLSTLLAEGRLILKKNDVGIPDAIKNRGVR